MDDPKTDYSRGYRMSATAKRGIARETSEETLHPSQYTQNFYEVGLCDSLNNRLPLSSSFGGGYASHPEVFM